MLLSFSVVQGSANMCRSVAKSSSLLLVFPLSNRFGTTLAVNTVFQRVTIICWELETVLIHSLSTGKNIRRNLVTPFLTNKIYPKA